VQNQTSFDQSELVKFALIGIDAQITELRQKREELLGNTGLVTSSNKAATSIAASPTAVQRKRRKMSAEHRAKLKVAAKLKWEKVKAAKK
jgi:hypothetical protein